VFEWKKPPDGDALLTYLREQAGAIENTSGLP
jgi:hypothetical protein